MTLSFQTKHADQTSTNFVSRIWDSLLINDLATQEQFEEYRSKFDWWWWRIQQSEWEREMYAKDHTIREDRHNRWRVGMPIHFVINNRRPDRLQFAPVLPVTAIQHIRIEKIKGGYSDYPHHQNSHPLRHLKKFAIEIDGKPWDDITTLSSRDGFMFDSQFINWWPEGVFEGKIIHWTNKWKY